MAEFDQNRIFAQSNLMKAYYLQKAYDKTLVYAEKVLNNKTIDDAVKRDAQIFTARAAMQTGDETRGEVAYAEVRKMATAGRIGSRGHFILRLILRIKPQTMSHPIKRFKFWQKIFLATNILGGKGLVLMAKNFYALNDAYQATYILESVITNFSTYEDVCTRSKKYVSKN